MRTICDRAGSLTGAATAALLARRGSTQVVPTRLGLLLLARSTVALVLSLGGHVGGLLVGTALVEVGISLVLDLACGRVGVGRRAVIRALAVGNVLGLGVAQQVQQER